jgi:hypothetical protein
MSPSQRMLSNLQKLIPGTLVRGGFLVIVPARRFLRGIYLEESLANDEFFLLWSAVSALYSPTTYVYLNKCKRRNDEPFHITAESVGNASQEALEVIKAEHIDYLRDLDAPEKFLRYVESQRPFNISPSFSTRVDRALTHFVLGNVRACIENLEEAIAKDIFPHAPVSLEIRSFLDDVRTNPDSAVRKIEAWECKNLKTLGLDDSGIQAV